VFALAIMTATGPKAASGSTPSSVMGGQAVASPTAAPLAPVVPPTQVQHTEGTAPHLAVYEVRAGDTLTSIAADLGTSVGVLRYLNPTQDPEVLAEGTRLRVPAITATVP